jgi:hypothetical protein
MGKAISLFYRGVSLDARKWLRIPPLQPVTLVPLSSKPLVRRNIEKR